MAVEIERKFLVRGEGWRAQVDRSLPMVEAFDRPDWLGDEVTRQRRYYNQALALHPYSTWPKP